jgi:RNA polymerase-interacting CarD/CdnL/TRCF family regulator
MSLELIVIVSNTLVVFATFLATLYRIKIERDQIQTVRKNAQAKECLESLRKYIKTERKLITSMSKEELQEFLDYLERLGKYKTV